VYILVHNYSNPVKTARIQVRWNGFR